MIKASPKWQMIIAEIKKHIKNTLKILKKFKKQKPRLKHLSIA